MAKHRKIVVTDTDRQRLGTLLLNTTELGLVNRRYLDDLEHELERATAVNPRDVPPDVITMNSRVRLRDLDSRESFECTLVYPDQADADANRLSVLAPVGTAVIGYRKDDVIEWSVPQGKIRLEVEEILFQPERAGRFDL
jgi:regulator of nucleoside diphosphate kinase